MKTKLVPPDLRASILAALLILGAALLSGCVAAPEAAQDGRATTNGGTAQDPNVALGQSAIRDLSPEQIEAYANGEGATMALAAELNGYAGPVQALGLADELELTPDQRERLEALRERVRADAVASGSRVLASYKALDDGFRNATFDEAKLAGLLEELAQEEAKLRSIHLSVHLEATRILTPHQKALYIDLRGYGRGDHASHER